MNLTSEYINPHTQFGNTNYELIMRDEDGNIVSREPAKFPDSATDAKKQEHAAKVADRDDIKALRAIDKGDGNVGGSVVGAAISKPIKDGK